MNIGDRVTAKKKIGGVIRDEVPAGAVGRVTQVGSWLGGETRVAFEVPGLFGSKIVTVRVEPGEI